MQAKGTLLFAGTMFALLFFSHRGHCFDSITPSGKYSPATLVVIRGAGGWDIDLYIDNIKILNIRAHSINYIEVPAGLRNVIVDIKTGSPGYCINTFRFAKDDTLPISFTPLSFDSNSIDKAELVQIGMSDLVEKQGSGSFEVTHSSCFSTQQPMPGTTYSQLMRAQADGKRFVEKNAFDSYGVAVNFGLGFGLDSQSVFTISSGKIIESEIFCMFTTHWGTGFRVGFAGDNFEMDTNSYSRQIKASIEIREMEYSWFLKIVLAQQGKTALFIEPGIGYISGSSKEQRTYSGSSYGVFESSADFQKVCFLGHAGIRFGMFEIRSGFYYGLESPTSKWFIVCMGVNFESKSRSMSEQ